jgi:uncharacterized protein YbaP (TraB family)
MLTAATIIVAVSQNLSGRDPESCNVFLWETHIEACTIFIAGSVHVGKKDSYPLQDTYLEHLEGSDIIILEVAEDFENIGNRMSEYIQKDRLPEDKYFRYTLSQVTKDRIIEILGTDQFHKFDQYNAWVLITQLSVNKMRLLDYDPSLAVDSYFRDLAVASGKEILGLESVDEQFRLLEFDLPYNVQLKIIEHSVDNIQMAAEKEGVLYDAYFNNQVGKFEAYFTERFDFEDPGEKAVYNKVFAERNKTWAASLEDLATKQHGTIFVAVGAGHLFGPGNLLECLREKGYAINQVGR